MFGSRSHRYLADSHAAGEKEKIKGKAQEFRNYLSPTNDRAESFRLEILWDQFQ